MLSLNFIKHFKTWTLSLVNSTLTGSNYFYFTNIFIAEKQIQIPTKLVKNKQANKIKSA